MRCNIWHVRGRDRDLMLDTGMGIVSLRKAARDLLDNAVTAVATHAHGDHVGGHHEFDDCLVHAAERDALANDACDYSLDVRDFGAEFVSYLNADTKIGYHSDPPQRHTAATRTLVQDPRGSDRSSHPASARAFFNSLLGVGLRAFGIQAAQRASTK